MPLFRALIVAGLALCATWVFALRAEAQGFSQLVPALKPGAAPLACQANAVISCGAAGCETEKFESGLPVQLDLQTAKGKGELCTYTYCRAVALMRWRDAAPGVTLLWSSASGSTPPYDKRPTYDFILSLAEDGKSFSLLSPSNGGVGGFSGTCAPGQK